MLPKLPTLLTAFTALVIAGCSSTLKDYEATKPAFDLKDYFSGDLVAYGMLQNGSGKITRSFCTEITGSWKDGQGTLDETFYFDDGEVTKRIWTLSPEGEAKAQKYTGTAGDVVGSAHGQVVGRAFNMHYVLQVPVKDKEGKTKVYDLKVNDWMYRLDDQHVMNRSTLSKFGIDVAEVTLFFVKGSKNCHKTFLRTVEPAK